jgi:hypothetical protein
MGNWPEKTDRHSAKAIIFGSETWTRYDDLSDAISNLLLDHISLTHKFVA